MNENKHAPQSVFLSKLINKFQKDFTLNHVLKSVYFSSVQVSFLHLLVTTSKNQPNNLNSFETAL